jgi:hypothetical protein
MNTFGRRAPAAPEQATSGVPASFFYSVGLLLLVMLSSAIFYWQLTDLSWLEKSPWDLNPGAAYDIGAFDAPKGCEPVRWAGGDYIARACVASRPFSDPNRFGLVEPPVASHPPLHYYWIDNGPNALLVACPMWAACKVIRVAEQRFSRRGTAEVRTPAAQAAARRPPLSYIIALSVEVGARALVVGLIAFAVVARAFRLAISHRFSGRGA